MNSHYIELLELKKKHNNKIALAFGCFDVLHTGHINFIKNVHNLTTLPIFIGVLSDKTVSDRKGPDRPIFAENDRASIMSALKHVEHAFVINERDNFELYKKEFNLADCDEEFWSTAIYCLDVLKPTEFYYSSDFKINEQIQAFFDSRNIKTFVVQYTENVSSTKYINKIQK